MRICYAAAIAGSRRCCCGLSRRCRINVVTWFVYDDVTAVWTTSLARLTSGRDCSRRRLYGEQLGAAN